MIRGVAAALTALLLIAGAAGTAATTISAKPAVKTATAAARPVKPATNWLAVVVATPEGGFRQGNPNARVKLLEFGALTCPHCAAFATKDLPVLRRDYIASGRVSYEYRPFILNGVDFAPALLVLCQPPVAALKLIDAFYAEQATWILPFTKPLSDAVQKDISALPPDQQVARFAVYGGIDAFVRTRGVTRAQFDACLADKAGTAKLEAIRADADDHYGLTFVPTFVINGTTAAGVSTWADLKPALDAVR